MGFTFSTAMLLALFHLQKAMASTTEPNPRFLLLIILIISYNLLGWSQQEIKG